LAYQNLSLQQIHYLAKLKQKKYRQIEGKVVVECRRSLEQLAAWGVIPLELYLAGDSKPITAKTIYSVNEQVLSRICDSEHPAKIAGLFALPQPQEVDFRLAFYLDGISDPGNMGTIFRIAAAFNVSCILVSPACCEISSPKVIRASLGAVYKVPFQICPIPKLQSLKAKLIVLDMAGSKELKECSIKDNPHIIVLGNEAHGVSPEILALADSVVRIQMSGEMESLNVAVTAGIAAYQLTYSPDSNCTRL